jgi:hypothetical protein
MCYAISNRGFNPVKVKCRNTTAFNKVVLLEIGADLWRTCNMTESGVGTVWLCAIDSGRTDVDDKQ